MKHVYKRLLQHYAQNGTASYGQYGYLMRQLSTLNFLRTLDRFCELQATDERTDGVQCVKRPRTGTAA